MGSVVMPNEAILFTGILYDPSVNREIIYSLLEEEYGSIILKSKSFLFTETRYYREEMGMNLTRVWVGFDTLIDPERITEIKLKSNGIEQQSFSQAGKRLVNIDPGYLTSGKVVLATTKNNQHRIYLQKGIYAEVTLRYKGKKYIPWEWTYKDYRRAEAEQFFIEMRNIYRVKMASKK